MASPIIAQGTGYVLFAYDVAHAFDLAAAETRLASATQRQTVKQKRRAPAFFEYDPAPLRVTEPADSLAVGGHVTAPYVEFVLYDFGAVSVSYAIPLQGPLTGLPALSTMLYGNEQLQADSRRRVQQLIEALGDAAIRSRLADFVEDYVVFQIEAFTEPLEASMLWTEHAQTVAQVLRAESRPLSQQEVSDALASRLSFGPNDATLIDTDVTLLFDPEGEDVRAVIASRTPSCSRCDTWTRSSTKRSSGPTTCSAARPGYADSCPVPTGCRSSASGDCSSTRRSCSSR